MAYAPRRRVRDPTKATVTPRPWWAAALALAPLLAACAGVGTVRREFDWFTVEVPEDWSFSSYREGGARPGSAFVGGGVELRGPDGRFLEVHRELVEGPLDSDAAWTAALGPGGRLELSGPDALCQRAPPPRDAPWPPRACLVGDHRLDVAFHLEAGGRRYRVHLGHAARERQEDLEAFRAMLGTFQAR